MAWIGGASAWMYISVRALLKTIDTGPQDVMSLFESVSDWEEVHGAPVLPMLALISVGLWVAYDAAQLLRGKFKDGQGRPITRWI